MKKLHRKEGFTLIELMIVILIIAILVAIAVPVYLAARTNAQRRTCQANLRTVDGGVSQYMAQSDMYPVTMSNLTSDASYKVLKSAPTCPDANTPYIWKLAGSAGMEASCNKVANHTYP